MSVQSVPSGRRRIAGERGRIVAVPSVVSRPSRSDEKPQVADRTTARPRPTVPGWLLAGLAILVAAAVVFDVIVASRLHTRSASDEAEAAATASAFTTAPAQAEKAGEALLSYGYDTLQADADAAKSYLTPAYAETFQKTVDDFLADPAARAQGRVSAKVVSSGVISADASTVKVLLFVDQTSTTKDDARPQTALNRVVLSLVKSGDRWLVDDLQAL